MAPCLSFGSSCLVTSVLWTLALSIGPDLVKKGLLSLAAFACVCLALAPFLFTKCIGFIIWLLCIVVLMCFKVLIGFITFTFGSTTNLAMSLNVVVFLPCIQLQRLLCTITWGLLNLILNASVTSVCYAFCIRFPGKPSELLQQHVASTACMVLTSMLVRAVKIVPSSGSEELLEDTNITLVDRNGNKSISKDVEAKDTTTVLAPPLSVCLFPVAPVLQRPSLQGNLPTRMLMLDPLNQASVCWLPFCTTPILAGPPFDRCAPPVHPGDVDSKPVLNPAASVFVPTVRATPVVPVQEAPLSSLAAVNNMILNTAASVWDGHPFSPSLFPGPMVDVSQHAPSTLPSLTPSASTAVSKAHTATPVDKYAGPLASVWVPSSSNPLGPTMSPATCTPIKNTFTPRTTPPSFWSSRGCAIVIDLPPSAA
ncbi:hypothetical protein C8R43DRAFT_1129959 [Mycena crocata]|nr:hypothetical protein C8R43DRAFT_1129959 [Mycena crocata]